MEQNYKKNQKNICDVSYFGESMDFETDFFNNEESYLDWESDGDIFDDQFENTQLNCEPKIDISEQNSSNNSTFKEQINLKNNQLNKKKKIKQGHGEESKKMKENIFYHVPYSNCEVYSLLKHYKNDGLKKIGEKYNEHFQKQIKENKLPKFGRTEKRNKGIAIWFFERIKCVIFTWLQN